MTSVVGPTPTPRSLDTAANLSLPELTTLTTTAKSRGRLVHCEISFCGTDKPPETRPVTSAKRIISKPTNVSGCDDQDAVTSLTVRIAGGDDVDVDLLPVCRFSSVERIAVVGRLPNNSLTSLHCFRAIRHVTLRHADIAVIRPSLIRDSFRSRDFRSVVVSDSGVEQLAGGVFDGRQMSRLEVVNLSSNNLTKIANATFVNLATLTTLNLSHNAIRYVAPHAFANTDIRYRKYMPLCSQCTFYIRFIRKNADTIKRRKIYTTQYHHIIVQSLVTLALNFAFTQRLILDLLSYGDIRTIWQSLLNSTE